MTLLVGSNTTTGFTTQDEYTNSLIWYQKYTAVATGTATALHLYGYDDGNAANIKLAIWNASGTLLAASGAISASGGGGAATWYSASITGTSIVSGTQYCLGFCGDAYAGAMNNGTSVSQTNSTNSYPTVNSVAPGTDSTNQTILMYADSASGPKPSQFFMSKLLPLAPLGWIIGRRNRLSR